MTKRYDRVELFLGSDNLEKLKKSCVMVVGVGGVGAICAESLARTGIGKIILIDKDVNSESNINRQIQVTTDNIGQAKVEALKERIKLVNPDCDVVTYQEFFNIESENIFDQRIDYVIDAIDTLTAKADIIEICQKRNINLISCLGLANRLDSSKLIVTKLSKTHTCPVAKILRSIARKRDLSLNVDVVFSLEEPYKQKKEVCDSEIRKEKTPPASLMFVPAAGGLLAASYVVRQLIS